MLNDTDIDTYVAIQVFRYIELNLTNLQNFFDTEWFHLHFIQVKLRIAIQLPTVYELLVLSGNFCLICPTRV